MAAVPCKRLFLVAFFMLCFFSIEARGSFFTLTIYFNSFNFQLIYIYILFLIIYCWFFFPFFVATRSLREVNNESQMRHNDLFSPKEDRVPDNDDLVAVDYTPARKKPPIHN
jgi:hypothetical protein